jgi:protein TonB
MVRSAHLTPQSRQTPDPIRIVGIATAIAVNLSIFAVLMQPMSFTLPKDDNTNLTAVNLPVHVNPLPKLPEPLPINKKQPPQPPTPHPPRPPVRPDPVVTKDTSVMSTAHVDVPPALPDPLPRVDPGPPQPPVLMSLEAIDSPAPTYPMDLLRDGVTGTVQLELLVGVDGRVVEVNVIHSSGNRELDNVAREQVLRNWRFKPAMRGGVAVQALGRVPIAFTLDGR